MEIEKLIAQISDSKKQIENVQKGILFFGNTGMGKSTLIHLILQNPDLYIYQTQDGEIIYRIKKECSNQLAKIKIEERMQSGTSIPITVMHNSIGYRDLPGFMDNRTKGENLVCQDFRNSFYYYEILKKTQYLKLILTVNASHIQGRATEFFEVIRNFKERFGSLSAVKKCTFIIFNKHRDEKIEVRIKKFIELCKKNDQNDQAQFMQQIMDSINFIVLPKLKLMGKIDLGFSKQINKKIQSLQWQKNDFPQKLILSDKIKSIFGNNRQRIIDQMNRTVKQFGKAISTDLKIMYCIGKKAQLIKQMLKIKSDINILLKKNDRIEIFKALKKTFQQHQNFIELLNKFEPILDFLDFISQINAQKSFYEIKEILKIIYSSIEVNINLETKIILFEQSDVAFVTTKEVITAKQIQQIIDANLQFNNFVFFLQEANVNSNIVAHGKSFFLFTKILITSQIYKILIDLSGKDGYSIKGYADDENGRPGQNGQNGGCFYLKADQFIGNIIQVDLSGGRGGDGQSCRIQNLENYISNFSNGEIFKTDCKNQDQDKIFLKQRKPFGFKDKKGFETFTHAVKALATFNGQVLETYQTDTLKAWIKYYKLQPGAGGHPGQSGKIIYFNTNQKDKLFFKTKVKQVIDKKPNGSAGKLILQKYQGKYQRQMVFCAARKNGMSYKQQTFGDVLAKQIVLGGCAIGGEILLMNCAKEAAKFAIKEAAQKALQQTGKAVITKAVAQTVSKQAIKSVTLSTAQTVGAAGILGIGASLGIGLAIQGIVSPISAYMSDEWRQQPSFEGKVQMETPLTIQASDVQKINQVKDDKLRILFQTYQKL